MRFPVSNQLELGDNMLWPTESPSNGCIISVSMPGGDGGAGKADPTSANPRRIVVAFGNRRKGDHFGNTCGAGGDMFMNPSKIIQRIMNTFVQGYSSTVFLGQCMLHST